MTIPAYYPYRSAEAKERYLAMYHQIAKHWPAPSQSRMVPTTYGETLVRIGGPAGAPPLVLLPGITSSSLFWTPNIGALSTQYRTYAVDRNGDVGLSTCTKRIADANDLVAWLDELFTALGFAEPINLVGLSYGGWVTALYALRKPERLRKIVLIAPGATVLPTALEFYLRGALFLTQLRYFARAGVSWMLEDLARTNPARVEAAVDRALLTVRTLGLHRPVGPTVFSDSELQSLRMPTLFIVGEHEKIYSATKAVGRLNRVAPQIITQIIPNAGHDLTLAQAELVNQKVLEFLE